MVVKAGVTAKPQRGIPVSVREAVWVWILSVTKGWGKVGRLEKCMESCAVTRPLLHYDKTCG